MRLAPSTLILALFLPLAACSQDVVAGSEGSANTDTDTNAEVVEEPAVAAVPGQPDLSKVAARTSARWDTIVAGDWIQVYDYMTPERQKLEPLGSFLGSKEFHEYRNPSKPHLIGSDGDEAYLELSVLWETHDPRITIASNNPGDLTQEMHVIETWTWQDGEWFWVTTERQKDFLKAHPNLGKKDSADQGAPSGGE